MVSVFCIFPVLIPGKDGGLLPPGADIINDEK